MAIDFEREYGVNAGYVQALFEQWTAEPDSVDRSWSRLFERLDERGVGPSGAVRPQVGEQRGEPVAPARAVAREPGREKETAEADAELQPLTGVAGRIAENMTASLALPTATSYRTVSAKLLDENRRILNEHMEVRALGKASYTHLIAFALVRALAEQPGAQAAFVERDGKPFRKLPAHVNLGLAIDVEGPKGRTLVVPSIKQAETLRFRAFHEAYEDVVRRGRDGKLTLDDYAGTTVTLTNPGGFGTTMSLARLVQGQGLIVATGAIGVPPELAGMAHETLAKLAFGPVLTLAATYDHRVIQGAESGLLLKRVDALLSGADGFWDELFRSMRVPWTPARAAADRRSSDGDDEAELQAQAWLLINAYRVRGGRLADLDPLEYRPDPLPSLDPAHYGFTVWDLDRRFLCGGMKGQVRMTLREILATLRRAYCRRWTVEYMHIVDRARKHWIRQRVEDPGQEVTFDTEDRLRLLDRLAQAEAFEQFLQTRYVGNKRFSLEGAECLIPALAEVIERAAEQGVERVVIGMAHRGRLNVLANILGKSYEKIFGEFEHVLLPRSTEVSGDVKYHLGQEGRYRTESGEEIEVHLCANPSHLEAVDPVVCGMTRAHQDERGDAEREKVLAVLVHGDAAFSGQGVVAETFNMSELRAYTNGGTVHLVVNNQLGFTASPRDLRSTYYCTDIAKGVEAPVMHANGDFPESVLRAARLAVDYRGEFGGDAVVDIVCYRRRGHNEGDEPAYTQPRLYARIAEHPTVRENYTQLLVRRGAITEDEARQRDEAFDQQLQAALDEWREKDHEEVAPEDVLDLDVDEATDYVREPSPDTGVPAERLVALVDEANAMPEGFVPHPKLLRQLRRREQMVRGERGVDWGCAEMLAFGSLVEAGVPLRLAGQDSGRGTFSQRHAVIHDQVTEAEHVPLKTLGDETCEVWDSLLSEEAALAFEYGYSVARPRAFVLWEAQFGDFVNGAQIPIDQFLVAGEAKWGQRCGLTLLLPHGYDGQGPEHSNARPERFLAACTGANLTVCNCSTSAQYFHLLRRQALRERRTPLVVFTPKSLLRAEQAASAVEDLARGSFRELLPDERERAKDTRRLILCTGKVYYELLAAREERGAADVAIARLEQLYPLPADDIARELERLGDPELVWCQEEPRNTGFWTYVLQRSLDRGWTVRYAGRPDSASPATGSYRRHEAEQARLIAQALEES